MGRSKKRAVTIKKIREGDQQEPDEEYLRQSSDKGQRNTAEEQPQGKRGINEAPAEEICISVITPFIRIRIYVAVVEGNLPVLIIAFQIHMVLYSWYYAHKYLFLGNWIGNGDKQNRVSSLSFLPPSNVIPLLQ